MDYKKNEEAIRTIKQAVRQLATNGVPVGNVIDAIKDVEKKFTVTEDEKIRRCISDVVRKYGEEFTTGTVTKEKMLTYLENKGEQKPVVNPKFKVGDTIQMVDAHQFKSTIKEIKNEGYLCNNDFITFDREQNWELVEQKPAWKPSDEQMHYLYWIANVKLGDSVVEQEVSKHLNELYQDLKKLKG